MINEKLPMDLPQIYQSTMTSQKENIDMQTFEFSTTAQNGLIKIPDEYVPRITANIKVIILAEEKPTSPKRKLFPDFGIDTTDFTFDREEANER